MPLKKHVRIARRFLRSIRIDADLGEAASLDGFVCPQSFANALTVMARHVSEARQGAFTWSGPYGSGKSSLIVALAALLGGDAQLQKQAAKLFGRTLSNRLQKALPPAARGWRIIPVVGRRDDPVAVIGEALSKSGFLKRRYRSAWTETRLMENLDELATEKPRTYGGLILFIDELGKFLEAAAQDGSDIYILQQLAEAASRSNGRLMVVGVLHQAFEEYAHHLSRDMRDEWAKIQGRFIDISVNTAGEEQIELISRAIKSDTNDGQHSRLANSVARIVRRGQTNEAKSLASILEACWPLHPVVASLLGPISRRRFGQNQRSIFGFLNSSETHGFQDFLDQAGDKDLYGPDKLWDYLRANLEPSILASPDGHRWSLAADALERCEALSASSLHVRLLKTIAVIDLFKNKSGLVANFDLLKLCLPGTSGKNVREALEYLNKLSLIVFKKFINAHAIYAGSDFDIEQAVQDASNKIGAINFAKLKELAGLQPILAKRHYHNTGSMRWFDVNIAPAGAIELHVAGFEPKNSQIGQFLLVVPTQEDNMNVIENECRKAARDNKDWDIVIGASKKSQAIFSLAREISALDYVSHNSAELAGDRVARREILGRLSEMQILLAAEIGKAFDNADWFIKGRTPKKLKKADLNNIASELADQRYCECPKLHNELLNRQKPSSSAVAAQNTLLRRMILNGGKPRLDIKGFPAERGLFESILGATDIYTKNKGDWRFASPARMKNDPCRLAPMWEHSVKYVKENSDRTVAVSELFDEWRQPPFGVKDGLMPLLAMAFILSQHKNLAIYREGYFRARFDDVDADYLSRDASSIQLRWMNMTEETRKLLSDMARVVRDLDSANELTHLEPIDVARGLIAIYDSLPQWTKRTMRLSTSTANIRDVFKRAHDPNKFLFDDIPATLGKKGTVAGQKEIERLVNDVQSGLEELTQAYSAMLLRLREIMFAELQVPNASTQSLAELRGRAENIKQVVGDHRLEAFIGRLAQFDGDDRKFEEIASLAVNKPPRDWTDPDLDQAAIELADFAQKFLRTETYARVKGRAVKRQALAVIVGVDNQPTPFLQEFDINDTEYAAVEELIKQVDATIKTAQTDRRNVILAALAQLSMHYMKEPPILLGPGKKKRAPS